ncbi:ATP phosphoribosyltransferase regulatory subunit [Paenibacillus sp. SC116]|uniref:ATP phosphoribosyltransferase regulatory subunit n=1 Tax=Paenibacillus sp. SC116 TaxID=2968986 RepID=UPI00215AA298|nr:ATP phosphoribosyltransferase regulatory subunit [Paenibacillus sp. SC116]MCR8844881.1 ATP phosphoribosyltransferase regulatory subunit [Paenibacillus sp. SC116]
MTKPKMFEKPSGVRDYLPEMVQKLRYMEQQTLHCMSRWGYAQLITPTMEFYDTVGTASSTSDHKLFKLLNQRGTTMVLRSDLTAPIARVVSSLLVDEPLPIRLSYHANVFRSMEEEAGREAEFYQTGAELIGDSSAEADAEVIALSIACLQSIGIEAFQVAIGHHGFLHALFEHLLPGNVEVQQYLKQCLLQRDVVGYREHIQTLSIEAERIEKLEAVLRLRGKRDVIEQARQLVPTEPAAHSALHHLEQLWSVLESYGVDSHLMLDLTMVGDFTYYTGTIFEGYAADLGSPVMSGGRYDNLLQQFGRPAPATGFAIKTTRMLDMIELQAENEDFPILVQYDDSHRSEAIAEAIRLRNEGACVITRRVEGEEQLAEVGQQNKEALHWNGRRLKRVLTFADCVVS